MQNDRENPGYEELRERCRQAEARVRELESRSNSSEETSINFDESNTFLNAVILTSPDGFWAVDKNGYIIEVNQAMCDMTGYSREELLTMHISEIEFVESKDEVEKHMGDIVSKGSDRFQTKHRKKDGEILSIEVSTSYVKNDEAGTFVSFCRDITERQKLEEKQRFSEELFRNTFQHSPMLMTISDLADGSYIDVNESFERFTGYSRDIAIGKTSTELGFITAEEREKISVAIQNEGFVENLELILTHAEGRRITCRFSGVKLIVDNHERLLSIATDITDLKQEEEAKETTIKLLRLLGQSNQTRELMQGVTALMQQYSECEAVGIRLKKGEDFPYYETRGFPQKFVILENRLCAYDQEGEMIRDSEGNPVLECMCGNVICGRFDPSLPFFTEYGSFWSNNTSKLLAETSEEDRQARTRNRCNGEGYESVALVPLRHGDQIYGLLQFNDHELNKFSESSIALLERLATNLAIGIAHRYAVQEKIESEKTFPNVNRVFSRKHYAVTRGEIHLRKSCRHKNVWLNLP